MDGFIEDGFIVVDTWSAVVVVVVVAIISSGTDVIVDGFIVWVVAAPTPMAPSPLARPSIAIFGASNWCKAIDTECGSVCQGYLDTGACNTE